MKSSLVAAAACGLCLSACSAGDETPVADETATTETTMATPEEGLRHYLLQTYPDAAPLRYALAWHDLNGDGADEAIVYLVSPYYCSSGGCNTLVLTRAGPMWREVGNVSVSRPPVGVADSATDGWQDLTVAISGGGGEAGTALLKFDGQAYPANPTVAPAEMTDSAGTELIAEEPEFASLGAGGASGS